MIINIDLDSNIAIYEQLKEQILQGILKHELQQGEQLPSVRQLSSDLEINMHTVSKVYKLLENEGLISINKKKGAFVNMDLSKLVMAYTEENLLKEIEIKLLLLNEIKSSLEPIKNMIQNMEGKNYE